MNKRIIRDNLSRIAWHIFFWIAFLSLPFLLSPRNPSTSFNQDFPPINTFFVFWFQFVLIGFFYLNIGYLIPRFFNKRKALQYWLLVSLCAALVTLIFYFLLAPTFTNRIPPLPIFPILLIFGLSWGYRIFLDRNLEDQRRKELDLANLKSELNFLRSQISPHFIFNILNSMVALARKQPQRLEPALIKLSELMRYMTYETSHTVPLSTEIDYLKGYIELQDIRFGDKLFVKFEVNSEIGNAEIEPMLLIPLVENAFKFGLDIPQPAIEIEISINSARQLFFQVRNRYYAEQLVVDKPESGIGLKNLQRRLNLLYPSNHSLSAATQDGWYIAKLTVNL